MKKTTFYEKKKFFKICKDVPLINIWAQNHENLDNITVAHCFVNCWCIYGILLMYETCRTSLFSVLLQLDK